MRTVKVVVVGLLVWPAAEIAAFVVVAALVGVSTALFLVVLISFAGLLVLRHFGGGAMRWRNAAGRGGFAAVTLDSTGLATGLGGILLVIPGFITGLLGVMTLLPASRRWLLAACRRQFASDRRSASPAIIDLAPNEWQPLPSPQLSPRVNPEIEPTPRRDG